MKQKNSNHVKSENSDSLHDRPLVTFALFSYNQEKYIKAAVQGAFAQTYSPLEIILSDDCSSDRSFDVLQELALTYHGPHKVILNRNTENVGLVGHVNFVCSKIAKGLLIVMAAGDDISCSNRTEKLVDCWTKNNYPACVWSGFEEMDDNGRKYVTQILLSGNQDVWMTDITKYGTYAVLREKFSKTGIPFASGAAAAWARTLFNHFGLLPENAFCEDLNLSWRSYLSSGMCYVNEVLLAYRRHSNNLSGTAGDQFESFRTYLSFIREGLKKKRLLDLNIEGQKDDLKAALLLEYISEKEFKHLNNLIAERQDDARIDYEWWCSGVKGRLKLIKQKIRIIGLKKAFKWSSTRVFPIEIAYYFRYLTVKLKRFFCEKLQ